MSWDDARIETAYRGLATRAAVDGVAESVAAAIREPIGRAGRSGTRSWHPWLAIAAVLVIAAVGVGVATIPHGSSGRLPHDRGLNHYHADGLDFDYPSSWAIHDQLPSSSGFGQTLAIIGTQPWPTSCGASDINCYYEAKLEPGTIAVDIGIAYYPATDDDLCIRGATGTDLQGRGPDDPKATRSLSRVDGRPTLVTTYDVLGKDYYLSDEWLEWAIAPVGTVDQAYTISAKVRGPGTAALKADLQALVASIRLTPLRNSGGSDPRGDCGAPFPTGPVPSETGIPVSVPTTSTPTPHSTGVTLNLPTDAPVSLPTGATYVCHQARLASVRVSRVGGSIAFRSVVDNASADLVWPHGFTARLVDGRAEIVAPDGFVVAREGDVIALGGGSDEGGFHVCAVGGVMYPPSP